ncbi:MAG: TetR/AcrR family transcriptional regulator [Lachnospira sp.]
MRHKNQSNEFIKTCIATAYINLLYEKPKEDITVTEICQKSGFGRTTYYRHFSNDKNELIIYIAKRKWDEYKSQNAEAVKADEGFQLLTHIYNKKRFMLMLKEQKLIELLFRILFEIYGIQETENPILRYGKDIFVGMYFGVIYDWIIQGCIDTPMDIKNKIEQGFAIALAKEK